jgi:pantetheine-phosphate adenylyltransferase
MQTKAVYPGSFDPITMGHVDIIRRIAKLYSEVTILVTHSPEKKYLFSTAERMQFIQEALRDLKNIRVEAFNGLTVEYVRRSGAQVIVRGLRAVVDFEYEMTMASMNKKLAPEIETILVMASPETYFISSRGVKEVAKNGGELQGLVPENVKSILQTKLKS